MALSFKKDQVVLCVKGNAEVEAGKHYKMMGNYSNFKTGSFVIVQNMETKMNYQVFAYRFKPLAKEPEAWL